MGERSFFFLSLELAHISWAYLVGTVLVDSYLLRCILSLCMIDDQCMFMYLMSLYGLVFPVVFLSVSVSVSVSVSIQLITYMYFKANLHLQLDTNHTKIWRCNHHIVLVTCISVSPN